MSLGLTSLLLGGLASTPWQEWGVRATSSLLGAGGHQVPIWASLALFLIFIFFFSHECYDGFFYVSPCWIEEHLGRRLVERISGGV